MQSIAVIDYGASNLRSVSKALNYVAGKHSRIVVSDQAEQILSADKIVFPGQGSQTVGMGRDLHDAFQAARSVFDEVDDALDEALSRIIFEGPEEDLRLTRNAQPALMAVSLAAMRTIEAEAGKSLDEMCACVAGHSLGEYSALAAAGSFSLADTARLLRRRGDAMQAAVPVGEGAMAALIGADIDKAKAVAAAAAEGQVCELANDNAPGQVVISGARDAVERAVALAPEHGIKRALLLPVSAPFHCALMQPAADAMAEALQEVSMSAPVVPVVANVLAAPVRDVDKIRSLLVDQVTSMVRWRECVLAMRANGIEGMAEVGAGKVLSGLARRIDREMTAVTIGQVADVEAFLNEL